MLVKFFVAPDFVFFKLFLGTPWMHGLNQYLLWNRIDYIDFQFESVKIDFYCTSMIRPQSILGKWTLVTLVQQKMLSWHQNPFNESQSTLKRSLEIWAHNFGHILTKKREISHTFALKKRELLSWFSFGQFCHKCELFVKVPAFLRF
jgi:hypothetical protein